MTKGAQSGGVQVVSVEEDGTYRVEMEALQRVLSHAAARALPACVVSVAGATRGGKSFLLDFFLRYLRATDEARRSGAWIGADDEPLTGFSWRGGCERDTNGIVVWPEPIIVQLGSEETSKKVAVVLMDTQGTFDNSSTVRDSSVIFAMSSLLSSVQIYNLSQNIKEDDLQYLHLFTEYGKLAQEETVVSPFQVLQFLVRDWSYAYEYPFGAEGGKQLLDRKLEIKTEQAAELSELRQHIRSVFEGIRCFLMPHPGLTVSTSAAFQGFLKDISPEFKNSLLEFIPSLFAPENIIVKTILGQEITVQDLPQYFQNYIEMFNSESLPSPVTVTRALSMASLEAALSAARAAYSGRMQEWCGGAGSVARAAVPRLHAAAARAAADTFARRRTLASPALAADKLHALLRELDAMLHGHVAINNNKIAASIASSKTAYKDRMDEGTRKCLLPTELEELHVECRDEALAAFEGSRRLRDGLEEDEDDVNDRRGLEQDLDGMLPLYREFNSEHISAAGGAARAELEARLRGALGQARCMHPRSLAGLYRRHRTEVLQLYDARWRDEQSAVNEHRDSLTNDLVTIFETLNAENNDNNNNCVEESLQHYKSIMDDLFDGGKCLHPRHLSREHSAALRSTRDHFLAQRYRETFLDDPYMRLLQMKITSTFLKLDEHNEIINKVAVERALAEYNSIMVPVRVGVAENLMDMVGPPDFTLFQRHVPAKNIAVNLFTQELRKQGPEYEQDLHLDDLIKKIAEAYKWLIIRMVGNTAFQGASFAVMTGLVFLRIVS